MAERIANPAAIEKLEQDVSSLNSNIANIEQTVNVEYTVNSEYINPSVAPTTFKIYKRNKTLIAQGYINIRVEIPAGTQFITLTNEIFANSVVGGHNYLHFGVLMKGGNTAYTILGDRNGIRSDISALPTGDAAIILIAFLE